MRIKLLHKLRRKAERDVIVVHHIDTIYYSIMRLGTMVSINNSFNEDLLDSLKTFRRNYILRKIRELRRNKLMILKYLIAFTPLLLLFTSCDDSSNTNISEDSVRDTIKYEKVHCPRCNGIGSLPMSTSDKVILGVLSFGPGALCDTKECELCRGTGIVEKAVICQRNQDY